MTGASRATTVGAILTGAGSAGGAGYSAGARSSEANFLASGDEFSSYSAYVSGSSAAFSVAGSSIGGETGTGFG